MATQILHSKSGRIMAVVAFLFSLVGLWALGTESILTFLTKSWVYIWFAYLAWLLFWNPSIEVSENRVVVDNLFRRHTLNWSAIKRIDTKYSLSIETDQGTIRSFAAPAPSRYASFTASKTEAEHLPESSFVGQGLVRPGDLTSSDSGVAAYIIRLQFEKLRDTNRLNETAVVETNWIYWRLAAVLILSLAALLGFIS